MRSRMSNNRKKMVEKNENIENLFGGLKNNQPFRVPENYFETFADRLKVRIGEEEHPVKNRSLFFYLRPVLSIAASIALVILLVNVPVKKFFPADNGYVAHQKLNSGSFGSDSMVPATLISYFSEGQLLSAVADMNYLETQRLSSDSLADYIATNYNDYDIIASN